MRKLIVGILLFGNLFLLCSDKVAGGSGAGNPGNTLIALVVDDKCSKDSSDTIPGKGVPPIKIRDAARTEFKVNEGYLIVQKIYFMREFDKSGALNGELQAPLRVDDTGGLFIEGPFKFDMLKKTGIKEIPEFNLPPGNYSGIALAYSGYEKAVIMKGTFKWNDTIRKFSFSSVLSGSSYFEVGKKAIPISSSKKTEIQIKFDASEWLNDIDLLEYLEDKSLQFDQFGVCNIDESIPEGAARAIPGIIAKNIEESGELKIK